MTLLKRIKARIPEEDNELSLEEFLQTAGDVILTHLYPLIDDIDGLYVPRKYHTLQLDIAVELYNKQGAEGETSHSENGVSRSYDSAYVSNALLSQIIPVVNVIGISEEIDE